MSQIHVQEELAARAAMYFGDPSTWVLVRISEPTVPALKAKIKRLGLISSDSYSVLVKYGDGKYRRTEDALQQVEGLVEGSMVTFAQLMTETSWRFWPDLGSRRLIPGKLRGPCSHASLSA